jgi:tetratricopeptide (TPR) repeat protein
MWPAGILLLTLLCSSPQSRTASEWTAAGWQALRAGHATEAAEDFHNALRLDGHDALAMLGAGVSAHLQGKPADAREQLASALAVDPGLTAASVLLGELLYRDADLAGAIQVYEQALALQPSQPQIIARLDAWRREAALHDRFSQKIETHFTILFEGPPDQGRAARVAEILEAAYWRIGGAIGAYPASVVQVVLYTRDQFRDITQSPAWAGGAYDGRIRVPVGGTLVESELQRVLSHELTHAIVYSLAPRGVPQWLNEGLAVLFEKDDLSRERQLVAREALIPLAELQTSFDALSGPQAALAYAESAIAAQRILDQGGPTAVYNLLSDLANGLSFDQAFERTALMSYDDFKKSWMDER